MSRQVYNLDGFNAHIDIESDDVINGLRTKKYTMSSAYDSQIQYGKYVNDAGVSYKLIGSRLARSGGKNGDRYDIIYQTKSDVDIDIDDLSSIFGNVGIGSSDDVEMSGKKKQKSKRVGSTQKKKRVMSSTQKKKRRKRCPNGKHRNIKSGRCVRCGGVVAKKNKIC